MDYTLTNTVPSVEQHWELAQAVGWSHAFRWAAIPASLAASVCGVVAQDATGRLAGMGRVVGDGAFYFYIQDVVVHPEHQGRGLGRDIVRRLTTLIHDIAGGQAFVGLFATPQAESLYASEGFAPGDMRGMWKVVRH